MSNIPTSAIVAAMLALGLVVHASESAAAPPNIQGEEIHNCAVITNPGFYRVTENLPSNGGLLPDGNCLVVAASFVTIDLGGFALTGDGTGDGISVTPIDFSRQGITVRDGTVTGFLRGIDLAFTGPGGGRGRADTRH